MRSSLVFAGATLALLVFGCGSQAPLDPVRPTSACAGASASSPPEDCERVAERFDAARFSGKFTLGSGSSRDDAIREGDRTAAELREARVRVCRDRNACQRPASEITADATRLDQALLDLLKLKEQLAQRDAESGLELLTQLKTIRAQPGSVNDPKQPSFLEEIGCSDGEREGFLGVSQFPRIAACAGGFSVPGVIVGTPPACQRQSGDDSPNPKGVGCSAADLCARGWHVCSSSREVAARSPSGCAGAFPSGAGFFVTSQSGSGFNDCGPGTDDLFGCGTIGALAKPGCAPLDRSSNNFCTDLGAPWACGRDGGLEARNVTKVDPAGGGALCCKD